MFFSDRTVLISGTGKALAETALDLALGGVSSPVAKGSIQEQCRGVLLMPGTDESHSGYDRGGLRPPFDCSKTSRSRSGPHF